MRRNNYGAQSRRVEERKVVKVPMGGAQGEANEAGVTVKSKQYYF